jgi:Tfp pilus assembly protein PilZ
MPAISANNQRRHLRFRVDDANAHLYVKGLLTTLGVGRANRARAAVNLSEGGALFVTSAKVPVGTRVSVRIEMEHYDDHIDTDGQVRWCFQSARNEAEYYVGVQFLKLPPLEASKIAKMREWFTSPEYRQKTQTRRRLKPPGGPDGPK